MSSAAGTKQKHPDSRFPHQSQRLRGTDQQISLSTCSPCQIPNSKSVLGKDQDIAQFINVRSFTHDHQRPAQIFQDAAQTITPTTYPHRSAESQGLIGMCYRFPETELLNSNLLGCRRWCIAWPLCSQSSHTSSCSQLLLSCRASES
jgi:hypothetical protein